MLTYPDMIAILSNMTQNNFNLLQLDDEAKNEAQCKGRFSVGAQDARPPRLKFLRGVPVFLKIFTS